MKKQNVLNLIKYHVEKNETSFRNEAINIARYFDSIGDDQLAEYIMGLIAESNMYTPQSSDFESEFLKQIDTRIMDPLNLPTEISEDVKGIINAVNHNVGINKFLFEGLPGSGKTEAAKHVARLLDRTLFCVDFDNLIDSKLGQTNKNISLVFNEINMMEHMQAMTIGVLQANPQAKADAALHQFLASALTVKAAHEISDDYQVGMMLAYTGAVKEGVIDIEELAARLMELLLKFYPQTLVDRYKVEAEQGTPGWMLLEEAGRKRGYLMARAEVNTERMAKVLLDEYRSGKLGKITFEEPEEIS